MEHQEKNSYWVLTKNIHSKEGVQSVFYNKSDSSYVDITVSIFPEERFLFNIKSRALQAKKELESLGEKDLIVAKLHRGFTFSV